ncbi:MAG: oligopeptide transporter, OPT family [Planctomycetota bacterium]|nr:MAG: oligopeptide transporter, OPT family [Planctomycetota bacterium]
MKALRESTPLALGLGVLIGLVMSVANVYLGLFAGMTVSASIPAAVISMGLLKGVLRRGTILENNMVQTVASAGESLAAGIVFTMPALVLTGVWSGFDFWRTTLVAMTGGLLGVLFMVPLRRSMIRDNPDLVFPEGVACAKVLQAGEEGGSGLRAIFSALLLGTGFKVLADGFKLFRSDLETAVAAGPVRTWVGIKASPALLAVGFIIGLPLSLQVFAGGALSWLVAAPLLAAGAGREGAALHAWLDDRVRFLGVGAMVVGGLWSILQIRHGIAAGLRETVSGYRAAAGRQAPPRTDTDLERRWLLLLTAATVLVVFGLYESFTGDAGLSLLATGLMVVCSFFFVAVAAYIVGLVGVSNSPVSGMTICAVLLTTAFVFLAGWSGKLAILATMGVAGVVCCATCTSGDVCQDLKTGQLVGATPARQQWGEVFGVVTASFVLAPVLSLLHRAYGIGTDAHLPPALQGHALEAPQAALFSSLMNGFFGDAVLPWDMIAWGAAVGLAVILVDQLLLAPRRSRFRLHLMPVAVGMYLSLGLSTSILAGGLCAWLLDRRLRERPAAERSRRQERGVLMASGLIAGEAVAGVLVAVPKAGRIVLPDLDGRWSPALSLLALAAVGLVLSRAGAREDPAPPPGAG